MTEAQTHQLPSDYEEQQKAAEQYQPDLSLRDIRKVTTLIAKSQGTSLLLIRNGDKFGEMEIAVGVTFAQRSEQHLTLDMQAILFSYFELLFLEADLDKVEKEEFRMKELTNTIAFLGNDYMDLFSGEMDVIMSLFEKVKVCLRNQLRTKAQCLRDLADFFDSLNAPHAIYMTRLLTNAYMRMHKESFELYLEVPLEDYCNNVIEGIDREIEELGIRALTDLLLSPAGYGLEVINLHDNPGSQVDVIPYAEANKSTFYGAFSAANPPVVRLFFYPTHYDIIYKAKEFDGGPAGGPNGVN